MQRVDEMLCAKCGDDISFTGEDLCVWVSGTLKSLIEEKDIQTFHHLVHVLKVVISDAEKDMAAVISTN